MMKQLLAFSLLILSVGLPCIATAQSENPFEIKERIGKVILDSGVNNDRGSDTINNVEDTILDLNNPQPEVQDPQTKVEPGSYVQKRQQMLIEENPFNVSHIPIIPKGKVPKNKNESSSKEDNSLKESNKTIKEEPGSTETENNLIITRNIMGERLGADKFMFWFFLIQLLLVTSILGINREFVKKINRSISNDNFAKLVSRDYNGGYDALFVIMYVLFILSLSIFIYLGVRHFYGISGLYKFAIILLSVSGVYLFRHIFLGFLGFIFPFAKTISYYNFMIILFNSYLGLLLIPVNVLLAYAPDFIANIAVYIGMGFVIISYLLRLLRGSLHAYTLVSKHVFHFFLYLCTCEIAPIFILVRFLSNSFSI